jgi:hypothetical protein
MSTGLPPRLEAGKLDHLSPLLGFLGDELGEGGGRAGKYFTAELAVNFQEVVHSVLTGNADVA